MKPQLTDDGYLKVTELDGMIGFMLSMALMLNEFQLILKVIPIWAVVIICAITWRTPMHIRYRDKKFSVKFGWDSK
jgi:hypothetical protein